MTPLTAVCLRFLWSGRCEKKQTPLFKLTQEHPDCNKAILAFPLLPSAVQTKATPIMKLLFTRNVSGLKQKCLNVPDYFTIFQTGQVKGLSLVFRPPASIVICRCRWAGVYSRPVPWLRREAIAPSLCPYHCVRTAGEWDYASGDNGAFDRNRKWRHDATSQCKSISNR